MTRSLIHHARAVAIALCGLVLVATAARAEELTVGVYLPLAPFQTNAERSAWGDRFAADLTAAANGAFTVKAQLFARREDALAFSGAVDVLVADGLFALERGLRPIAHVTASPAIGLYAADATRVGELQGKAVAAAQAEPGDLAFYSNTVLGGELVAADFFAEVRALKDASAALAAVKSKSVAAAFAPVGHPAAAGLRLLRQGGAYPIAVVAIARDAKVAPVRDALTTALGQCSAGALGTFGSGSGGAFERAAGARGTPRVKTAPAFLTGGTDAKPMAPPIRLKVKGRMPPPALSGVPLARPDIIEPQDP